MKFFQLQTRFSRRVPEPVDGYAPGVDKPSTTLAYMLVAEMLQNLSVRGVGKSKENRFLQKTEYWDNYQFPSFSFEHHTYQSENEMRLVLVKDRYASFDDKERKILLEGFEKFLSLSAKQKEIERERRRQDEHLKLISQIMQIPEEEGE